MATLKIKRISDFQTESVQWLWEPYIPLGAVTILQGDGGLGKSTISCLIAAAVTNGKGLPGNGISVSCSNVIMQNAEDSYTKTIRPRLEDFGADTLNGRWYWQMPIDAEYEMVKADGHGHENAVSMSFSLLDGKAG